MALRPNVQWQELEGTARPSVWTRGWLPDTETLRWSLANYFRVEGVCDGWHQSRLQADAVAVYDTYVAENETGDWIEVTPTGASEADGEVYTVFQAATVARLDPVVD